MKKTKNNITFKIDEFAYNKKGTWIFDADKTVELLSKLLKTRIEIIGEGWLCGLSCKTSTISNYKKSSKKEYIAVYSDQQEAYKFDDLEECEKTVKEDLDEHSKTGTVCNIYSLHDFKLIKTFKKDIIEIKQLKDI